MVTNNAPNGKPMEDKATSITRPDLLRRYWELRLLDDKNKDSGSGLYSEWSPQTIRGVIAFWDGVFLIKHIDDGRGKCECLTYGNMLATLSKAKGVMYQLDLTDRSSIFEFCGVMFKNGSTPSVSTKRRFKAIEEFDVIGGYVEKSRYSKDCQLTWMNVDIEYLRNMSEACKAASSRGENNIFGMNRLYGYGYIARLAKVDDESRLQLEATIKMDTDKPVHYRHFCDILKYADYSVIPNTKNNLQCFTRVQAHAVMGEYYPGSNTPAEKQDTIFKFGTGFLFKGTWCDFNYDNKSSKLDTTVLTSTYYVQDALPTSDNPEGGVLFKHFMQIRKEVFLKQQEAQQSEAAAYNAILQEVVGINGRKLPCSIMELVSGVGVLGIYSYLLLYAVSCVFGKMEGTNAETKCIADIYDKNGYRTFFKALNEVDVSSEIVAKFKQTLKENASKKGNLAVKNYQKYLDMSDNTIISTFVSHKYNGYVEEMLKYLDTDKPFNETEVKIFRTKVEMFGGKVDWDLLSRSLCGMSCITKGYDFISILRKCKDYNYIVFENQNMGVVGSGETPTCTEFFKSRGMSPIEALGWFTHVKQAGATELMNCMPVLVKVSGGFETATSTKGLYAKLGERCKNVKIDAHTVGDWDDFNAYLYFLFAEMQVIYELAYTYGIILNCFTEDCRKAEVFYAEFDKMTTAFKKEVGYEAVYSTTNILRKYMDKCNDGNDALMNAIGKKIVGYFGKSIYGIPLITFEQICDIEQKTPHVYVCKNNICNRALILSDTAYLLSKTPVALLSNIYMGKYKRG